jgi:hypothetical protein
METLIAILLWFGWISPNSTYSTSQIDAITASQATTIQVVIQNADSLQIITTQTQSIIPTVIIFDPDQE